MLKYVQSAKKFVLHKQAYSQLSLVVLIEAVLSVVVMLTVSRLAPSMLVLFMLLDLLPDKKKGERGAVDALECD